MIPLSLKSYDTKIPCSLWEAEASRHFTVSRWGPDGSKQFALSSLFLCLAPGLITLTTYWPSGDEQNNWKCCGLEIEQFHTICRLRFYFLEHAYLCMFQQMAASHSTTHEHSHTFSLSLKHTHIQIFTKIDIFIYPSLCLGLILIIAHAQATTRQMFWL